MEQETKNNSYLEAKKAFEEAQEKFEAAKKARNDEFFEMLESIMKEYEKGVEDICRYFNLELAGIKSIKDSKNTAKPKQGRTGKCYTNPNTGESVTAKSFLNSTLKAWAEEYGKEEVESWGVEVERL